jgi:predicted RNase H-like HicB family nuclease
MHRFLIVIERTDSSFSAYSPDLSGCVATGATREETSQRMYEALQMHVAGLIADGHALPASSSVAEYIFLPA